MTEGINWGQKRLVYRDPTEGDYYIKVFRGFMTDDDYKEGGQVITPPQGLELVGEFTNAQIDRDEYRKS